MATRSWDAILEEDLAAARRRDARAAFLLVGVIVLIGAASVVHNGSQALAGEVPSIGRMTLGLLAILAGLAVRLQYRIGWGLAAAWAALQIPVLEWSLAGSPTTQVISLTFTFASNITVGQHVDHTALGVNFAGVIFLVWLIAWRYRFTR
jgi:tetrahydromethanopterin S-methyltransferase subunit C